MARLFVGNFDFEHELSDPCGWRASTNVRRMLAERACSWISLADDGDWIWTPEPIAESFWDQLAAVGLPRVRGVTDWGAATPQDGELTPWGWTQRLVDRRDSGAHPNLSTVRIANSRSWSFDLEQEFGVALPGAARIERVEDFSLAVDRAASCLSRPSADQSWVVKARFGMAGRERLLGRGNKLSESQRNWMQRRMTADSAVYFEPWLTLIEEVGIQWDIPRAGEHAWTPCEGRDEHPRSSISQGVLPTRIGGSLPELVGCTTLLTDLQGGYRGSVVSLDTTIPPKWQSAVAVTQRVAERLQAMGYVGPLGVDAAVADDGTGRQILRPLQDINARFTMGRLALGFRRFLQPGQVAEWRHDSTAEETRWSPEVVRRIATSPTKIGNSAVKHRSELVIRQPSPPVEKVG